MTIPSKTIHQSILLILFMTFATISCKQETKQKDVNNRQINKNEGSKPEPRSDQRVILFFGNSLTAGYGLEEQESFPSRIQHRIDSLGLPYKVVNGGLSGETTADGANRIDWILKQPIDVFVLELGANDMLRGLDLTQTELNLSTIIDKVKSKYPDIPVILTGMQAPPNLGNSYTDSFAKIFPDLAKKYNAGLVPFLLDGIAGDLSLNQSDRIHPNAQGAEIMAENVWLVLKKYMK